MSHPHWPIFPSAFVEKTTNAKDGKDCSTVSEANVVSKECCFTFTNGTVLFPQFVSSDGRCVSQTLFTPPRKKGFGGGGRVKKESQLRLLFHHALKQFNPESVTVQKRVIMNRLYL